MIKRILCILLAVMLPVLGLAGCSPTGGNGQGDLPVPAPAPDTNPDTDPAGTEPGEESPAATPEQLLASMTLEEKIGQLFIIRPEALDPALTPERVHSTSDYGAQALTEEMAARLARYPAGGIILFGKNIAGPDQLESFLSDLDSASSLPLLFCTDEEGGSVSRIANAAGFDVEQFESAAAIGATGDPMQAYHMGQTIGEYLNRYGFHLDFAPVADINSNPANIIIGSRSFGSEASTVSSMVNAMIDGLHCAGILTCVKHFPGHGDTSGDSHDGYVQVNKTWEELLQCELIPFIGALDKTDLVMAAHITAPRVTGDGLPASLSHTMLTEKLRGELGYNGVIITDALAMGAITQNYSSAESAVLALQAGADLLLMPEDYIAAYQGVLAAVEDGTLSEARIDESVLRVLRLKSSCAGWADITL